MPPKGYRHLSIREEVYKRLEEFAKSRGLSTTADAIAVLLDYADIYSKIEYILQKGVSLPQSGVREQPQSEAAASRTSTKERAGGKITAWDILKRDKISCMSNIKVRNPTRVIESLFEAGAVKIDLGRDVCVVDPDFWWEFWRVVKEFKTPNDEENLKEIKNEKMKWLYSELRREGIIIFDSARKPPAWTFDKRVEIPEKAFEIAKEGESQGTEEAEMEDVGEYERYGEM